MDNQATLPNPNISIYESSPWSVSYACSQILLSRVQVLQPIRRLVKLAAPLLTWETICITV